MPPQTIDQLATALTKAWAHIEELNALVASQATLLTDQATKLTDLKRDHVILERDFRSLVNRMNHVTDRDLTTIRTRIDDLEGALIQLPSVPHCVQN